MTAVKNLFSPFAIALAVAGCASVPTTTERRCPTVEEVQDPGFNAEVLPPGSWGAPGDEINFKTHRIDRKEAGTAILIPLPNSSSPPKRVLLTGSTFQEK